MIAALVLLSESHLGVPVSTAADSADARVRTETRAHGVAGNRDAKVPQTNLLQTEENLFPVRHTDWTGDLSTLRRVKPASANVVSRSSDGGVPRISAGSARPSANAIQGIDDTWDDEEEPGQDSSAAASHSTEATLLQFIDVFQWVLLVMVAAVLLALGLRKWTVNGRTQALTSVMEHIDTIPVRNLFQAHLLRVGDRRFLVTTDRTGVKSVDPVSSWEEFGTPVESLEDHQPSDVQEAA